MSKGLSSDMWIASQYIMSRHMTSLVCRVSVMLMWFLVKITIVSKTYVLLISIQDTGYTII